MAKSGFRWINNTLTPNLLTFEPRVDRALTALTEKYGQTVEDTAKLDAPWTDRTGNARNGLFTVVEHAHLEHRIILAHRVPYGIWLEVRWDGRYQVIMPTLQKQGKLLMAHANRLLIKMGAV